MFDQEKKVPKPGKKLIFGVAIGFILLILGLTAGKVVEDVDAGEIVVIQSAGSGTLTVYKTPGLKWQLWGKATHYKKSNQMWFTLKVDGKDTTEDGTIPVKWNDGGTAKIDGSVRYDLPLDDAKIIQIHSTFGSQEAIERDLIKTNIDKAVSMTGPLMTSKESYAEKKNDLIYYIEDQASKGAYKTRIINIKETDPLTGDSNKSVSKVEILMDDKNQPFRQETSPIFSYGVRLYNVAVKDMHYSADVEAQIRTQQQATMQVQTAIANAKRAEQEAITTAKQGEADAAKAKWEQEVIKATIVTQAQAKKEEAALDVQTADLVKQRMILEGEGESAKKRLVMQANGALEQKLEAYIQTQKFWAEAFSKYQGNIVPQIQTGGTGGTGNGAMNLMDIIGMKTLKDLSLDLKNKE